MNMIRNHSRYFQITFLFLGTGNPLEPQSKHRFLAAGTAEVPKTAPRAWLSQRPLELTAERRRKKCCSFLSTHSLYLYLHIYTYIYISKLHLSTNLYLSIDLSIHLSIHPSIHLFVYLFVYPSICLSVNLPICLSVYISVYLSTCLSIYLSSYLPTYLSIYLPPIHPSTCPPVHPSNRPPVHPSTHPHIHPSTHPPIHPSIHPSILSISIYPIYLSSIFLSSYRSKITSHISWLYKMDTYLCDSFWDITYIHLAPMATAFTPVRQANHPTETRRADIENHATRIGWREHIYDWHL